MSIVVWQHGTSGGQVRENLRVRDMEKKVTKLQLTNEQLAAELNQETPCIPVLFPGPQSVPLAVVSAAISNLQPMIHDFWARLQVLRPFLTDSDSGQTCGNRAYGKSYVKRCIPLFSFKRKIGNSINIFLKIL